MRADHVFRALAPIDAKSIGRDPLLRWLVAVPLLVALMTRWLVPTIARRVSALVEFDLTPWYPPLLAAYLLLMVPLLAGWVIGFLLLDQRDDGTLTALRVTPLTLEGYLVYRLAVPTVASVVLTPPVLLLSGLWEAGFGTLLLAALAVAPLGPVAALLLGCFAANKVQGFALVKASGILVLPPFVAYFVPGGFKLLLGLAPTTWGPLAYWSALDGNPWFWLHALAGLVLGGVFVLLLTRRFDRVSRT